MLLFEQGKFPNDSQQKSVDYNNKARYESREELSAMGILEVLI